MSQSSLIESLTQMNNEFVEQVDTISGTLLEVIHNTAMQMFYTGSLTKLRTMDSLSNAERIAGLRDLGNWVSSSTFLSSAMIYNSQSDTLFTSGGGHVRQASETYADQATVQLMISRSKHGSKGALKRKTSEGEIYSFLFFEERVPDGGALLLNVRASWYEHQLLGITSEQSSIIVDDQGEILVAGHAALQEEIRKLWPTLQEKFEADRNHGFILQPGGKSGWMYYQLTNLGLYYLRAFNTDTILPRLAKVQSFTLFLLIMVTTMLIAGGIYTVFVLYLPIRAIKNALLKAGKSDGNMVTQVDRLLESEMEQHLTKQVENLLQGNELEVLAYPVSLIMVASSECDEVRSVVAISTSLPTLIAPISFGCAVLVSGATEKQTLQLCLDITDLLDCRCLYGEPKNSAQELAECHGHLLDLWQQRFLYVGQKVLSEKLVNTYHRSFDFQTQDMDPLFSALRAGQLYEARTLWKGIFDKIRYAKFNEFRFFVRYILKYLNTLQGELGLDPLPNAPDIFEDLEDVSQLHQLLDSIFVRIVSTQNDRRKSDLQQLAHKINQRIAAGYADDSLSAQSIADEMGMNAVYLGRLYRESAEMSISEAIKRMRIEKAKELLQVTSNPVKAIASEVGFANTKYFFVVFKELVGMTPKEFQSQAGN